MKTIGKLTKADLAAREESRRNSEWLRQLAEQAYEDLRRRGALTIERPDAPLPRSTHAEMRADREQARANSVWLQELAAKAKADLDRRNQGETR